MRSFAFPYFACMIIYIKEMKAALLETVCACMLLFCLPLATDAEELMPMEPVLVPGEMPVAGRRERRCE